MSLWDWFKEAIHYENRELTVHPWPVGKGERLTVVKKPTGIGMTTLDPVSLVTFNDPPKNESDFDKMFPLE